MSSTRETPPTMQDSLPDKEYLYGKYQAQEDRLLERAAKQQEKRDKLAISLAHKALDIPEREADPMDLNVDNRRIGVQGEDLREIVASLRPESPAVTPSGLGVKKLAALVLGGLSLGGAGLGAGLLLDRGQEQPPPAVTAPAEPPGDAIYHRLEFVD